MALLIPCTAVKPIATAARLSCTEIYNPVNEAAFDKTYRVGETVCGRKLVGKTLFISNQGTDTEAGWAADAHIFPVYHPVLGNLHAGFYQNLPELVKQLTPDIRAIMASIPDIEIIITGHSKGAGEGAQLGALLKLAGFNVVFSILFACPNAGYQRLTDWLASNLPGLSFRNAPTGLPAFGDPVPLVPVYPNTPPYAHTMIDVAPSGFERVLDIAWHEAAGYETGATDWELANLAAA